MVEGCASDREISMATTLSIVDGALDLGQGKRRHCRSAWPWRTLD